MDVAANPWLIAGSQAAIGGIHDECCLDSAGPCLLERVVCRSIVYNDNLRTRG